MTPSGNPAIFERAAAYNALNGVCSAGFNTIVQPAASAGAHFHDTYYSLRLNFNDHFMMEINSQTNYH